MAWVIDWLIDLFWVNHSFPVHFHKCLFRKIKNVLIFTIQSNTEVKVSPKHMLSLCFLCTFCLQTSYQRVVIQAQSTLFHSNKPLNHKRLIAMGTAAGIKWRLASVESPDSRKKIKNTKTERLGTWSPEKGWNPTAPPLDINSDQIIVWCILEMFPKCFVLAEQNSNKLVSTSTTCAETWYLTLSPKGGDTRNILDSKSNLKPLQRRIYIYIYIYIFSPL